eukprot:2128200-Pleurochrysis_carterae.AAC.1
MCAHVRARPRARLCVWACTLACRRVGECPMDSPVERLFAHSRLRALALASASAPRSLVKCATVLRVWQLLKPERWTELIRQFTREYLSLSGAAQAAAPAHDPSCPRDKTL